MHNVKLNSFDLIKQNYPRCFFFITLISSICAIVIPSRDMIDIRSDRIYDRSIILQNHFVKRSNQLDTSSRLISCTVTFIKEYFEDSDRISLLFPEKLQNDSDFVETLIRQLYVSSSVYTLNMRLIDTMTKYDISSVIIILLENAIALEKSDFSFMNYCKRDCNFAIVLTNPFDDEESFLNDASMLTQEMWLRSILKLAILASVGDAVLFADSLVLRIDKSYAPVKPELLGRCEQNAVSAMQWRFADKTKLSPVASTINAAIFESFPYTFIINDNVDHPTLGGIEGWMVEEIVRSMKVKLNRKLLKWTNNSTVPGELYLRLYNATDDLVFGGFLRYPNLKTQYTVSYGIVHIAWMVPMLPNVSLRGLISSFSASVWYAIICTFIIGGLANLLIYDISMLDITALFLGVPTYRQPRRTSSRIQFISWTLFGFFLTQFYLGLLAEQLINTTDEQIDSIEELANSGLMLGGIEKFANLLNGDETDRDEHDRIMRTIHNNYIIFDQHTYIKQFIDLIEGRNTSLALLVMLNLTDIHHYRSSLQNVHIIEQIVGSYPLGLGTWEGFPYLKEFNLKIQVLIHAGLIKYWSSMAILYNDNYYEKTDDETNSSTLDLDDIAPAFLLLIMGCLGGFCVFIAEVIFYPSRILM